MLHKILLLKGNKQSLLLNEIPSNMKVVFILFLHEKYTENVFIYKWLVHGHLWLFYVSGN